METDHIVQAADGGPDTIDNAIPVCFECHAEIHSYNDRHPRGRKFLPEELRAHKEQWLDLCRTRPEILLQATRNSDVGPLQALIDELEFNVAVAKEATPSGWGCPVREEQFGRAISEGAISTLEEGLKGSIIEAYAAMGRARACVAAELNQDAHSRALGKSVQMAMAALVDAIPKIMAAHEELLRFLRSD